MIDEKDPEDGSDWLSSQFDATAPVPAPAATPSVPPAASPAPPSVTVPPSAPSAAPHVYPFASVPSAPVNAAPFTQAPVAPAPVTSAPAAAPAPEPAIPETPAPAASAPVQGAGGGFSWGLKPGGTVPPPAPVASPPPLVNPPLAPPPLVSPPPVASPSGVTPPTEPDVAPPTQPYVPEPTKPLSWSEFAATQQRSAPAAIPPVPLEQATEAYTVQPWQPAATPPVESTDIRSADPTSAIDSLFGDHRFQDYEEVGVLKNIQVPPASPDEAPLVRAPREPLTKTQKVLLGVAAGLLGALILVGLYFLGHHLGTAAAAQPTAASTSASSTTPTPAGTGGPAAPGTQQWTALQGGECIQPFSSAWALTFTVVACTADHDAQMVFKGKLPDDAQTQYPTAADFQKEITPLCRASTAINYAAAVSVTDLQVSFSYPPNTARWLSGDRTYYCFVDRASGGNLPGDLSVPKAP